MGITQIDMLSGLNKVQTAIALIQAYEPPAGYYVAFSGGKDSVVMYDLVKLSGVRYDVHYSVSPIDPKEIHTFIRSVYPEIEWDFYAKGFWDIVRKKGLPMRQARWCCQVIKEAGGIGRVLVVGNRSEEGTIRSKQKCFEQHRNKKTNKSFLRPIITWEVGEVWEYIRMNNLPYCSLYNNGFHRLGCVLCPFSNDIKRELYYFPKITALWRRACDQIVADRVARGNISKRGKPYTQQFTTGLELWNWWISRKKGLRG